MGPWLIGMILGYVLFIHKSNQIEVQEPGKARNTRDPIEIDPVWNAVLWIAALSTLLAVVFLSQPFRHPKNDHSLISNAIYIALSRLAWAVALSWIIFACHSQKHSGYIVQWFLEAPFWQPIGRMCLSMNLVHVIYQKTLMMNERQPIYMEIWPMVS